jgi:hypothetical protein
VKPTPFAVDKYEGLSVQAKEFSASGFSPTPCCVLRAIRKGLRTRTVHTGESPQHKALRVHIQMMPHRWMMTYANDLYCTEMMTALPTVANSDDQLSPSRTRMKPEGPLTNTHNRSLSHCYGRGERPLIPQALK